MYFFCFIIPSILKNPMKLQYRYEGTERCFGEEYENIAGE